jgi:hypothetical protein
MKPFGPSGAGGGFGDADVGEGFGATGVAVGVAEVVIGSTSPDAVVLAPPHPLSAMTSEKSAIARLATTEAYKTPM